MLGACCEVEQAPVQGEVVAGAEIITSNPSGLAGRRPMADVADCRRQRSCGGELKPDLLAVAGELFGAPALGERVDQPQTAAILGLVRYGQQLRHPWVSVVHADPHGLQLLDDLQVEIDRALTVPQGVGNQFAGQQHRRLSGPGQHLPGGQGAGNEVAGSRRGLGGGGEPHLGATLRHGGRFLADSPDTLSLPTPPAATRASRLEVSWPWIGKADPLADARVVEQSSASHS
jgi:hypothetical protein